MLAELVLPPVCWMKVQIRRIKISGCTPLRFFDDPEGPASLDLPLSAGLEDIPNCCSSPSPTARVWLLRILASNSAEDSALPAEAPAAKPFVPLFCVSSSDLEALARWELTVEPNFRRTDEGAPAAPDFPVHVGMAMLSFPRSIRDWRRASAALCAICEACSSSLILSSSWAFIIASWFTALCIPCASKRLFKKSVSSSAFVSSSSASLSLSSERPCSKPCSFNKVPLAQGLASVERSCFCCLFFSVPTTLT
uniref:Uncharacterized protein n=1 Tax=Opuntia streptacantha TaxID=393608 RepID=A0A7C9DL86_OPUST